MSASQIRLVFDHGEAVARPSPLPPGRLHLHMRPAGPRSIGPSPEDIRLYGPLGRTVPVPHLDPARFRPDPRLLDAFTPERALAEGVLPLRQIGSTLIVLVTDAKIIPRLPKITGHRGMFLPYLMTFAAFENNLLTARGSALAHRAETCVPSDESCRGWSLAARLPFLAILVAGLILLLVKAPGPLLLALVIWGLFWMTASTVLKLLVLLSSRSDLPAHPLPPAATPLCPPIVTLIVALYREADIAPRLIARLGQLDYPRDRLDVILAVEDDDTITQNALSASDLPPWMRVIRVPKGGLRTKPRALNHAMTFARGSIIGVYDAEDAPTPGQLRDVVTHFASAPPEVACLQGVLDFYNPNTNWLARCFTVEYAAWFRVMLPGLARLGLVLPLGGTTLFFRRNVLEALGGWDAHNVTEDADLGLRLARHGFRTELIQTVTDEEANCRFIPWVRQRSRWIKGYMMTWAVHMRDPRLLLRQLGWKRFLGVQVLFLGSISQTLLVPLMLSLWMVTLGLGHPIAASVDPAVLLPIGLGLLLMEVITFAINLCGMYRRGQGIKPLWVLSAYLYFPLAAFAGYKAVYEVFAKPFYWDKTSHGHFDLQ